MKIDFENPSEQIAFKQEMRFIVKLLKERFTQNKANLSAAFKLFPYTLSINDTLQPKPQAATYPTPPKSSL